MTDTLTSKLDDQIKFGGTSAECAQSRKSPRSSVVLRNETDIKNSICTNRRGFSFLRLSGVGKLGRTRATIPDTPPSHGLPPVHLPPLVLVSSPLHSPIGRLPPVIASAPGLTLRPRTIAAARERPVILLIGRRCPRTIATARTRAEGRWGRPQCSS
jgi:hypothetical protein